MTEQTPALDRILNAEWLNDMPPRLPSQWGFGCENCPFGTLNACNTLEDVRNDESEAYYDCALLGEQKIWGENPKCNLADWQRRAREELASGGTLIPISGGRANSAAKKSQ